MALPIYPVCRLPAVIPVGIQSEEGVTQVRFDVRPWLEIWPDLQLQVWHTRPGESEAYPTLCELDGDILTWHVSEADTAISGRGAVEVVGTADGVRKLAGGTATEVLKATVIATKDAPAGIQPWYDSLMAKLNAGLGAVDAGEGGIFLVTEVSSGQADRTADEIRAAVEAGNACFFVGYDRRIYTYYGEIYNAFEKGMVPAFVAHHKRIIGKLRQDIVDIRSDGVVRGGYFDIYRLPDMSSGAEVPAYLHWDGTAWVAATVEEVKAELGVKEEGEYELIETITLEADTASIVLDTEPDGTAYSFEAFKVDVVVPAAESQQYVTINYKTKADNVSKGFYISDGIKTNTAMYTALVFPVYNNLLGFYTKPVANEYDAVSYWIPGTYYGTIKEKSPITAIRITAKDVFPAGTTIKIWGVRANA